jgi:hypothetical protein
MSKAFLTLLALVAVVPGTAETVLNFQDISIPGGTDSAPFSTYSNGGFTLTAPNNFDAHGSNSIFYAGAVGVVAFAPSSAPDNVIDLEDGGSPFDLLSIDLARNFAFDPAPTVTFTGTKAGGGTVTQSFTVTTPSGTSAFQTFDFSGFTDLDSVTWGQPVVADGVHQFTNIHVEADAVATPEPSTWPLLTLGIFGLICYRRQRSSAAD